MGFQPFLSLLLLPVILFSCKTPGSDSKPTEAGNIYTQPDTFHLAADTAAEILLPETGEVVRETRTKIILHDDTKYSAEFLTDLAHLGDIKQIELIDSLLIFEKMDTFRFPLDLPENTWFHFFAIKNGLTYALDLKQVNFTTLSFNLEQRRSGQVVDQLTGKAHLNAGFFLGSESDEDDQTGISYFSNDYYFEDEKCSLNIRLGYDEGLKKVKLSKTCATGQFDIDLDDCPVLLEK